jgi:hypothetical protein
MTDKPAPIPAEGGSYVVDAKGRLDKRQGTIGPLDPAHAANRPKPATEPVKES